MNASPTLTLLHGHGVDASIWDNTIGELTHEISLQCPDFSRLTDRQTIDDYAEELRVRLNAVLIDRVLLVGHSMGGYIALAFAEKYPDLVSGLVLFHSTAVADDEVRKEKRKQAVEMLRTAGTAPFMNEQMPKMVAPDYPAEKTQYLIDRYQSLPADALIAGMEAMATRPDRTHVLHDATYPVLLVLGHDDQIIPFEKAEKLADLSEQIQVEIIPDAGHLSMIEQPAVASKVLRDFIQCCL